MEIRNVERQSATKYKVTTYEEYHIRYGDGSVKFKSFNNDHIVTVNGNGKILYHSLGANNTLKSEEVSGQLINAKDYLMIEIVFLIRSAFPLISLVHTDHVIFAL